MIKVSAKNSLELVGDLLNRNSFKGELTKEPIDLKEMLQYSISMLTTKAEEKGQRIDFFAKSIVRPVNRAKIWRVMSNLITNAIKFSPNHAVISVSLEKKDDKALIIIKDHGIGISQSDKNEVFSMFSEAKREGTAGEEAFGLGLAISKQIVESHNGKIWFESEVGKGTTFFVEL